MQRRTAHNLSADAQTAPRRARAAFTLIELLVVVSIIALLIGLLLPGLGYARRLAQDTLCKTNQRNIMPGWYAYITDNRRFPNYQGVTRPDQRPPLGGSWGGASTRIRDHFGQAIEMRTKPLNEYLGLNSATRQRMEFFQCPRDTGAIYAGWGASLREGYGTNSVYTGDDTGQDSMYFLEGNSYYANDWIWANVGAIDGAGPLRVHWNHRNVPDQVLLYPSDTMAIADAGAAYALSMTEQQQADTRVPVGWWHDDHETNMAMWDGSVRTVRPHLGGEGPEFNRWLIPERHAPEGTPIAFMIGIRNPDLAHSDTAE